MSGVSRLMQAAGGKMIRIESIVAYHKAFDIPFRLGWFIDAIQMVERVRLEMNNTNG